MENDPQSFVEFILDRLRWGPGYERLIQALSDEGVKEQLNEAWDQYWLYRHVIVAGMIGR